MNFGLTILAIFYIVFLIVPGVFFKRFYFQSKFQKEFSSGAFADKFITSIFWGLIIQLIVISLLGAAFSLTFDEIYLRCKNVYVAIQDNKLPTVSEFQIKTLLVLFLFSMVFSCMLGYFLHKTIRILKLDVKFSPLRFANDWNYIFRNELNDGAFNKANQNKKYYSTEVDVLVNDAKDEKPSFYQGILHDYHLDDNGNLERISLSLANKRVKIDDNNFEIRRITGDTFIIPYKNVSNMNLRFNYTYKSKKNNVLPIVRSGAMIIILGLFMFLLIGPWLTEASVWYKIITTIVFFWSWAFLIGSFADVLSDKSTSNVTLKQRFVFITLSILTFFFGLHLLNVFHLIQYIIDYLESWS